MIQPNMAAGRISDSPQRQKAGMSRLCAFLLTCLFVLLTGFPSVQADAQQIEPGSYKGVSENGKTISFDVKTASEGFEIAMNTPDLEIERLFRKQGSQTIYPSVTLGMLSMFGSERTAKPLDGDPLIWARDDDEAFILYSMQIDQSGHFQLFHFRMSQNDEGIVTEIEHRTHGMDTVKDRVVLKRL